MAADPLLPADVTLTDGVVDIVASSIDVAIRVVPLQQPEMGRIRSERITPWVIGVFGGPFRPAATTRTTHPALQPASLVVKFSQQSLCRKPSQALEFRCADPMV
jgi:DNA-binding transcriptional LysR family regulator